MSQKPEHENTLAKGAAVIDICRGNSAETQPGKDEWLFDFQIENGPLVRFRHVTPADAELISDSIRTASSETLLHRFFAPIRSLPIETLRTLLHIDHPASLCLVGEIIQDEMPRIICGVRFVRSSPDEKMAEFAITVHDEFQKRGLGVFLMRKLAELAKCVGVVDLEGYVLYSNTGMRHLIQKMSPAAQWSYNEEVVRVVIPVQSLLIAPPRQPAASVDTEQPKAVPQSCGSHNQTNSTPKSMKRMFVRLARLLSMKRRRSRSTPQNEQPQPPRPRVSFRRRPR